MSTNKRIDELDVLKGIGIILMMLDHCFAWGEKVFLHALIQSFHMPLFFIVSGYLWQNKDKTTNFIRHKVNTILVPHFNFAIIYSLVFIGLFALGKISGEGTAKSIIALFMFSTRSDLTMFASPIWFFQALFLTEIVFTILEKKTGKFCGWIVLIIAILGITYSKVFSFMLPFALEAFSTGILFFYIGIRLKNVDWIKFEGRKYWLLLLMIVIWIGSICQNGCVDMRSARYYNPILYIVNGALGTIIFWNIAHFISCHLKKLNNVLQHFSICSITYLCVHYIFVFYGNRLLCRYLSFSGTAIKIILFVGVVLISWILNKMIMKYVPRLIGKKNV